MVRRELKLPAGLAATGCRALQGRIRWAEGGAGETLNQSDKGVVMWDTVEQNPREVRRLVYGDSLSLFQFFREIWTDSSGANMINSSKSVQYSCKVL